MKNKKLISNLLIIAFVVAFVHPFGLNYFRQRTNAEYARLRHRIDGVYAHVDGYGR